jgi:hypothetical protein
MVANAISGRELCSPLVLPKLEVGHSLAAGGEGKGQRESGGSINPKLQNELD